MPLSIEKALPMSRLCPKLRRFFISEDGPTAVEYAVMLALIVIVCIGAIASIGSRSSSTFTTVGNRLGG